MNERRVILSLVFFFVLTIGFANMTSAWTTVDKTYTQYTGDTQVEVMSEQLYNKRSFEVGIALWDTANHPYVRTPSNEIILLDNLDFFEHCRESYSSEQEFHCWFEYQFNEEGIYIFGYKDAIGTPLEEDTPYLVVKVEDNLGIDSIWSKIYRILRLLGQHPQWPLKDIPLDTTPVGR